MSKLSWRLLNAVQLIFTLSWTAGWISAALVVSAIARRRALGLAMARRIWAPGLLWGAGAHLEVEGVEHLDVHRPYMVVANHQSVIDVPVLFRVFPRPIRFVAKRELGRLPFLGWYMKAMGMILVERQASTSARAAVETTAAHLEAGESVVTFPEGTRGAPGRMRPFKSGGFAAALAAEVEVLPVAISGSARVLPRGGFAVRPGLIRVKIGAPLAPAAGRAALAEAAERAVQVLYEEIVSH